MYKKTVISLIASGLLAVAASSTVLAGVQGTSFIDLTNVVFLGSNGEILDFNNDFNLVTFTTTADLDAALGAAGSSDSSSATPIDLPVLCEGACPQIAPNVFPVISGAPAADYATSDQFEDGAPILNIPSNGGVFATGARVANGAYAGIAIGNTDGSANSNNNLNSSFEFTLDQAQGITVEFTARAYLEAFVSGVDIFPSFATAAYSLKFSITDLTTGNVVFDWQPDGAGTVTGGVVNNDPFTLNSTVSLNAPLPGDFTNTGGIFSAGSDREEFFSATTNSLAANTLYQLSTRLVADTDVLHVDVPVVVDACRLTGGGVATDETTDGQTFMVWDGTLVDGDDGYENRYQFGGQAGANTALPPQPKGEWQHHQQRGPAGSFSFHTGTASAPAGTEIVEIRCSDPGGCSPSGNPPSPNKQLDFDCIGTFKNIGKGKSAPTWLIGGATVTAEGHGNKTFDGTFHWCEVNVDDLGEGPDPAQGDDAACPPVGFGEKGVATLPANCDCPDFYRITVYDGVDAANVVWDNGNIVPSSLNQTDVIYEVEGYLGRGGNGLQLHSLTGFDRK